MALENSNISDWCYDGTGFIFLYSLEADPSRPKMVGLQAKNKGENYADIRCCDCYISVRNYVCPGPSYRNRINSATGE